MGLEIGAQTPDEIAISILAEIIAVRRGLDPSKVRTMKMDLPGRLAVGRTSDKS
jgi:xanthine/CO dehydrogenase XdhC/CoxF family maturation factor